MKQPLGLILIHLLLWTLGFFLISPWPLGLVSLDLAPMTTRELAFFLCYGFLLNATLTYTYAHLHLPVYIQKRKTAFLLLVNLVYLLGFTLLESMVDCFFFLMQHPSEIFFSDTTKFKFLHILITWGFPNLLLTFVMLAWANFYGFAYAWFRDQKVKGDMEREKLRAELSALKHQINPHFLFNILNALYGLAFENDDEPTAEGIAKLSNMMRYLLYESNDDEVLLKKELAYLQQYIDLQKMRVDSSVEVIYKITGNPAGHMIPPMIFLPFVENAFKYGISQMHPSRIEIEVHIETEHLVFRVSNTKHPVIQEHTTHKGIGIKNVKKRLELLSSNRYQLDLQDGDHKFVATLELELMDPLQRKLPLLFSGKLKK